jgi:two-component system LytT family response regulator
VSESNQKKIRAVIVDDEELSRVLVKDYLTEHPDIEVVAECSNGFEAVRAVNDLNPDLLLLDIQMPKLDGFEVLELIGNEVEVLFITAFDEYALRAFEVHALDYLLKPFSAGRFSEALNRARARLDKPATARDAGSGTLRKADSTLDRILIRNGPKVHVIAVQQIDYIKAEDDYIAVMVGGKAHLKHQTLASLEQQLDPGRFVRIHRSIILNIDRLAGIELYSKDSYEAVHKDNTRLAISRSGHAKLQELI